jgi:hypothetical protein
MLQSTSPPSVCDLVIKQLPLARLPLVRKNTGMAPYTHRVISFLWAVALVVTFNSSYVWLPDIASFWPSYLALGSALVLLAYPTSLRLLQLSAALFIVSAVSTMPALPNHRVVLLFIAITILASTYRSTSLDDIGPKLRSTLRWLTVVVYLFAALAKFNWSYLDPSTSCASLFFTQSLALHGITLSPGEPFGASESVAAWWSSITEIMLLILLVPRRTRHLAVIVGVLFHILLATHYIKYFANFSAAMFILLASWLSEESCRGLVERYIEPHKKGFLLGAMISVAILSGAARNAISDPAFIVIRHLLFMIFACSLLVKMIQCARHASPCEPLDTPLIILIVAAVINGLCPYLGIKTRTGFSMYGNLRIEPTYSNHLFMPKSPDILGYMSDVATITSTTDPVLEGRMAGDSLQLPYISLCTSLAGMDESIAQDAAITYERGGITYQAARGTELPSDCPSWLARKLFFFSPIGEGAERVCVW